MTPKGIGENMVGYITWSSKSPFNLWGLETELEAILCMLTLMRPQTCVWIVKNVGVHRKVDPVKGSIQDQEVWDFQQLCTTTEDLFIIESWSVSSVSQQGSLELICSGLNVFPMLFLCWYFYFLLSFIPLPVKQTCLVKINFLLILEYLHTPQYYKGLLQLWCLFDLLKLDPGERKSKVIALNWESEVIQSYPTL